jgi:signal transduction histidine kinase/DNA-binding NarL/FixJ family response regulator/putative methionine-R-sulfoxide reductase with GAF domain
MSAAPPLPWRLLFIEDLEPDFALLLATLQSQGYHCVGERVYDREGLVAALDQYAWDAVIADYRLPSFGALEALAVLRGRGLDLPFLVVSGAISEDQAVATMRAGAHDYLPKHQLARLGVSLAREIGEAQIRAEQRRLTESLDRALAEAELLNAIVTTAAGQTELPQILAAALEHLRQGIAFTGGSIALREGDDLTIRAAYGPFADQALGQSLPRASNARSWQVIDTGLPFLLDDAEAEGLTPTTPIRSYLATPLIQRGQTIGLLEVDSTQPRAFSPADVRLLEKAALRLAGPVEVARRMAAERAAQRAEHRARQAAEQAARQAEAHAERLRRLQALTAALSQAVTPEAVIDSAVRQGASALGTTAGGLSLVSEDEAWLETVTQVGYPPELARTFRRVALEAPTPGTQVARSGKPLWLGSPEAWKEQFPDVAAERVRAGSAYQAMAILPLHLAGSVAGIVAFSFAEPREFDADDRAFLSAIAAQCEQALERARLYAAEREAAQAATLLARASAALAEAREPLAAVQQVVELVAPAQADVCLVELAGSDGLENTTADISGPWVDEIARAAATGRPHLTRGASLAGLAYGAALGSFLVVPLTAHGQVLGAMAWATTTASGRRLADHQLALAEELAHRVALAVDNGRLYAELEARVAARTAQLHASNASLEREIVERTAAEAQLQRSRDQLRDLSARLQAVREEERTRIAYRVHDELGQLLAGMKMDLAWLNRRLADSAPAPALAKVEEMAHLIDAMVQTVRLITTELRPGLLDDFGLAAAIEWQLEEFAARTNVAVDFERAAEPALSTERATALFRIFQEALNNVAWHAQATRVRVRLEAADGRVSLSVHDNGRGLSTNALSSPKSLGLLSMRERARLLDGDLDISSAAGQGTRLVVMVPEGERERP